jgi:hypothetical protein
MWPKEFSRSPLGHVILVIALAVSLAFAAAAPAGRNPDDEKEIPREESDWSEIKGVRFPPIPKVRNLIRLDPESVGTRYEYFIDGPSILLGTDQVIRYTVVLQSDTGVRNVFFEGIRCETMAAKTYGYASRRGGFKPLTSSTWKDVRDRDVGPAAYRLLLADKFMCDSNGWPIAGEKARAKLTRAARRRTSGRQDDDPF